MEDDIATRCHIRPFSILYSSSPCTTSCWENSTCGGLAQGIASDLKRTETNPQPADADRISHDNPDLVAYWTFEEGSGYVVRDVSDKGHDLHIQQPPQWRVSYLC